MKTPAVDPRIVSTSDCQTCRRCCTFAPHELSEAPLFADEQRTKALKEFSSEQIEFVKRGTLWQVILRPLLGTDKHVCPFFDIASAQCRIYSYGIFDCHTWPFYVMNIAGKIVITVSQECPVAGMRDAGLVDWFARNVIGPKMLEIARIHPDLILPHNENVRIIYEVEESQSPNLNH